MTRLLVLTCMVVWTQGAWAATATVTTDGSRLRDGPGTSFKILQQFARGDTVELLGQRESGWCQVRGGEVTGWLHCTLVREGDADPSESTAVPTTKRPVRAAPRHRAGQSGQAERHASEPSSSPRAGFFFDGALGIANGNFTITGDDTGDTGAALRLSFGGVWANQFGLTGTVTVSAFAYEASNRSLFGSTTTTLDLGFLFAGPEAWFFVPLSDSWELGLHLGLGLTQGKVKIDGLEEDSEYGVGVTGGAGIAWFFGEHVGVALGLHATSYGVGFQPDDDEFAEQDGVTVYGLELSIRRR